MAQPYMLYQQYSRFFTLDIKNITELSVHQIQELESFTKSRNGMFSFEKAQIKINKRLEMHHLVQLFSLTSLDPYIKEKLDFVDDTLKKSAAVPVPIGFGKHRGTLYGELPGEYLIWLKRNYRGGERDLIETELKRRGL